MQPWWRSNEDPDDRGDYDGDADVAHDGQEAVLATSEGLGMPGARLDGGGSGMKGQYDGTKYEK